MFGIHENWLALFIDAIEDLEVLELRDVLGNRIVGQPLAFFVKNHHCDASNWLGHRVVAKDGVLRHGRMRLDITLAVNAVVHDLAVAREYSDGPGQLLLVDFVLNDLVKNSEPFAGKAGGFRRDRGGISWSVAFNRLRCSRECNRY